MMKESLTDIHLGNLVNPNDRPKLVYIAISFLEQSFFPINAS